MKMISVMPLLLYPEEQRKMAFNAPFILVLHLYDLFRSIFQILMSRIGWF